MKLAAPLLRALFRGSRLLDVPAVLAQLRFADLRRRFYDELWQETAARLGATCEKWDFGYHRLNRGGLSVVLRLSELRLDDHLTLDLMGNKLLTYRLLAEQGFAVPRHTAFTPVNLKPALALMAESGQPVVVKPVGGTGGGNGVTTGIGGRFGLTKAAWLAARFDTRLIAEEQIEGHSYRLLFLDGALIDAVRRDPPRVTGDGRNTIAALVAEENRRRLTHLPVTALSPLRLDRDALNFLKAQGLTPRSIPASGATVIVKRAVNQNAAADNHVVTNLVHAGTADTCARLAANLGVRLAGIDILARDIALPLTRENGLIGEINTTPGLHHHHLVAARADGASVAGRVVDQLFRTRSGVIVLPSAAPLRKVVG